MSHEFGVPPVAASFAVPSTEMSWLPPSRSYSTTPQYPQTQLAPSNSGFDNLKVRSFWKGSSDSRRNFASIKRLTGFQGLGDLQTMPQGAALFFTALAMVSSGLCAFHGYRRHRGSIPWAIGWGLFGAVAPVLAPAIGFAEGFAKPMKR